MSSFKTVVLAALLSAAAYGVYVLVTAPPSVPPKEAAEDWELGPQVELPEITPGSPSSASQPRVVTAPAGAATSAPPFNPRGALPAGDGAPGFDPHAAAHHGGGAPPYTAPGVGPELQQPTYPSTGVPEAVYETPSEDSSIYAPAGGPTEAEAERYPSTDRGYPSTDRDPSDERYPSTDEPAPDGYASSDRYPDAGGNSRAMPVDYESQPAGEPAAEATAPAGEFPAAFAAAQALLDQGRLNEAHLALSQWFDDPRLSTQEEALLMDLLDRLAGTVIYSRQHLLEPAYEVQPGDTLPRIAETYNVPWQLLAKINGIADPEGLQPGNELKVVRGPFDAVVDLDQLRLTLFLEGRYAGRFSIGVGQDQSVLEGEFVVLNKLADPIYYGPDRMIAADDPANPLGEYALDLGNRILLHGTNDPRSIGSRDSRGCIRLSPTDIQDVFDILSAHSDRSTGSQVIIRR